MPFFFRKYVNIETEGGQFPVLLRSVEGVQNVINISEFPGTEFIFETVDTSGATVETVIQMPAIESEMEVNTEEVLETTQTSDINGLSSEAGAVLDVTSKPDAVS